MILTIAEVAARFGVTHRTLPFYEQKGMLGPRREGTRRLYDEAQVARVEAIRERRRLGFQVPEIAAMLARHGVPLPRLTPDEVAAQIAHLERQLVEIDAALAELRAMLPAT